MKDYIKYIEIELLNGKRILIAKDISNIYKLYESERIKIDFSLKFPFIRLSKERFVSFRIRTQYSTIDSPFDPRYKVKCTLQQFCNLVGLKITSFEQNMIENDLNC